MDSRFANLRQRDTSVSMLRVKLSRRRSQSQKENRERVVNTRRQLDKLQELENSTLDASNSVSNMSTIQEKMHNKANSAKSTVLFSITSSTILTIWNIPLFLKALTVAKWHLQPFAWDRTSLILTVHDVSFLCTSLSQTCVPNTSPVSPQPKLWKRGWNSLNAGKSERL